MSNLVHSLAMGCEAVSKLVADMSNQSLDINEADTRHRFIDRLLYECLGWSRPANVNLERHFNGEYSDYELGSPPQIVVEAKRAGKTFLIPSEGTKSILRSIRSLTANSVEFREAFNQSAKYCAERGIQIGAVANASQIIVFLGVRSDGVPPIEGKCLAFSGYEQIVKNFPRLWSAISPSGAEEKNLLSELSSDVPTGVAPKISNFISNYPSFRYPSESQQSLKTLCDLLVEDAPNTPALRKKFLEECYCESGALAKEALLGKQILSARYAAMFNPSSQGPTLQALKKSEQDKFGLSSDVVAEALGRRPIVIIGDVGVGKTSFIRNLIYVKAADEMANAIFLYLDLGSQASLGQEIHSFFLDEIERQLFAEHSIDLHEDNFVRGVYHGEMVRFDKGIYGRLKETAPERFLEKQIEYLSGLTANRIAHLQKSISHLSKGRQKQVVICIDNADQRDSRIQQEAFLAAQEFAASWDSLVLISIRPRTYFTSKYSGSISAYPQRILTISPPRIDLVLQRRLQFSMDLAQGRQPIERLEGITLKLDSIAIFLKALIYSLRNNRDLSELLGNITGGNIREALELVKGFVGSANVDSQKIIDIMENGDGSYVIPVHEFSKQALLGEYAHYDAKSSIAFNLFDVRYPSREEHFLCPLIVGYLMSENSDKTPEGFFSTGSIIKELQRCGFVGDQIEHALRRLTNKKLIEATERITFDEGLQGLVGDMPLAFRATTVGAYHINRWAPTFAYIDAMLVDTPIADEETRQLLISRITSFDIRDRYIRSNKFIEYLNQSWQMINRKPVYFDWVGVCRSGTSTFDSVKRAVDKINSPKKSR